MDRENSRWSTGSPRRPGAVDQERQLLLHPLLSDELAERRRAQREVEIALLLGPRGRSALLDHGALIHPSCPAHLLQRVPQQILDVAVVGLEAGDRGARLLRGEPERQQRLADVGDRPRALEVALAAERSRRSITTRCATFLPTPGTTVSAATSPVTARRRASGASAERKASATFGPTPVTPVRASNEFRSSAEEKPYRTMASSRTTSACVHAGSCRRAGATRAPRWAPGPRSRSR